MFVLLNNVTHLGTTHVIEGVRGLRSEGVCEPTKHFQFDLQERTQIYPSRRHWSYAYTVVEAISVSTPTVTLCIMYVCLCLLQSPGGEPRLEPSYKTAMA